MCRMILIKEWFLKIVFRFAVTVSAAAKTQAIEEAHL